MSEFFNNDEKGLAASGAWPSRPAVSSARDDMARFILRNRARIRRRVLAKIRRSGSRPGAFWLDPDDITSSVFRRIDTAMLRGALRTQSEHEFWAFVIAVTDNLVFNRLRAARNERAAGGGCVDEWSGHASMASCRDDDEAAERFHQLVMSLTSDEDRELALWRAHGASYREIAAATGRGELALRARWAKICRGLRERFAEPGPLDRGAAGRDGGGGRRMTSIASAYASGFTNRPVASFG